MSNNGIIQQNFLAGSYQTDLNSWSCQLSDNLYFEPTDITDQYTNGVLRSIEGTTSACTFDQTGVGCRGLYWSSTGPAPSFEPQLYAAYNNSIYRIDSDFNKHFIGTVGDNSTIIQFAESGGLNSMLCVVDGYNMYVCPLSAADADLAFTTIDLPKIPGTENPILPTQVTFLGGRIIVNSSVSDFYFYTDTYTIGTSATVSAFNGDLNFAKAETQSDFINGLIAVNGTMWIFGPRSYQVYQWQNNQYNPFITVGTAGSQIGCKAPKSIVSINNQIFWLGSSNAGENVVFVGTGINDVSRLSTNAIEREISKMIDATDAIGQTWTRNGHTFYSLTFPRADKTFVYDLSTKQWANRSTRDKLLNIQHLWEPQFATLAYGKIMFGTYNGQSLIYLDDDKFTEYDGRPIVRTRISPVIISQFSNVILNEFELEIGTGQTTILEGQGSKPQAMLQVSKDGGHTWSNEIWRGLGRTGQYWFRTKWLGLGMGRLFVIKVSISDPVKVIITGVKLRFTQCNSF